MKNMRWSLRNQAKIEKVYGRKGVVRITIALNRHFGENKEIESMQEGKDPYETIYIKDIDKGKIITFYVIGRTYNVYNLALKSFTK